MIIVCDYVVRRKLATNGPIDSHDIAVVRGTLFGIYPHLPPPLPLSWHMREFKGSASGLFNHHVVVVLCVSEMNAVVGIY